MDPRTLAGGIQSVQRKLAAITHDPSPDEEIALKTVLTSPPSQEEVMFEKLVSSVTHKQLRRTKISSSSDNGKLFCLQSYMSGH